MKFFEFDENFMKDKAEEVYTVRISKVEGERVAAAPSRPRNLPHNGVRPPKR